MNSRSMSASAIAFLVALVSSTLLGAAAGNAASGDPFFSDWETFGVEQGLPSDKVFAVLVDGPRIWAGTEKGLARLEGGEIRVFGKSDGLPFAAITALALDRQTGDLWVGTMGGLARVSGGRIDAYTQMDSGLVNDVIYGVATGEGKVWIATAAGLSSYSPATDEWEIFDTTNTLMHEPWCYAVTTAGETVYVAVWGGGIVERDAQGHFREHRDPDHEMEIDLFRDDGLVHDVTSGVAADDGILWAATYFGLSRYEGRRWQSYNVEDSGLVSDFINHVRARGQVVWIATDRGFSRFDSEVWHTWHSPGARAGYEFRVHGADGTLRSREAVKGPDSNMIFAIDLDGEDLWLATAAGLSHGIARRGRADGEAR